MSSMYIIKLYKSLCSYFPDDIVYMTLDYFHEQDRILYIWFDSYNEMHKYSVNLFDKLYPLLKNTLRNDIEKTETNEHYGDFYKNTVKKRLPKCFSNAL